MIREHFFVWLESPTHGTYLWGRIEVVGEDKWGARKKAQEKVKNMLIDGGLSANRITLQVTDYSSLRIGDKTVSIKPVDKFDEPQAKALAALLT